MTMDRLGIIRYPTAGLAARVDEGRSRNLHTSVSVGNRAEGIGRVGVCNILLDDLEVYVCKQSEHWVQNSSLLTGLIAQTNCVLEN